MQFSGESLVVDPNGSVLCKADTSEQNLELMLLPQHPAQAKFETPMENPYVIALLERLGFATIEDFLEKSDLLDR